MSNIAASLKGVSLSYGKTDALRDISLEIPAGKMVGLIGPDGVGKSSLLSLLSGARALQTGKIEVLGGDMASRSHRNQICPGIAYMPQGLGRNLYPTLSVEENLQFFARLFGHNKAERRRRIDSLTRQTGLHDFLQRPAGKLSGGMKQKLGLCCALIHDPELLILDEPTTGVDPLARAQFWQLIASIRQQRPDMSVVVATAYMDEARRFDDLVVMNDGQILATGTPEELLHQTGASTLEQAFIRLLPDDQKRGHQTVEIPPLQVSDDADYAIEAEELTMRFGDFTAVDKVSLRIRRGEIFGFLGSNGCGKTTTMKMLTGLLPATSGEAKLFGHKVEARDIATRRRVGYMSQSFSLYSELSVAQNLALHARLFSVPETQVEARCEEMLQRFGLTGVRHSLPGNLPMGLRQRLSLAVAMVHKPELLILDEPTSGVDPVARDQFWQLLGELSRRDRVTIFISTHFMNEAERCDRMSMMHAGRILDSDTPQALTEKRGAQTLEEAFIRYLVEATGTAQSAQPAETSPSTEHRTHARPAVFSPLRLWSYLWRESLELQRDPIRATLALVGSLILMLVMGYGISLDVNDLSYAVLDYDQTSVSESYQLSLEGSPYFYGAAPLISGRDMEQRLQSGELTAAIEIPPGFGRDLKAGNQVEIGAWVNGAMPTRGEMVMGYMQGIHYQWLADTARASGMGDLLTQAVTVETRYRYNPEVKSLPAIVPAIIPILLLMMPAMLTALSVVREKELGSIVNLYVTPVTRTEFLVGKQLPYVALAMLNFLLMCLLAVTLFGVPVTGDFLTLSLASLIYCLVATGMGLLVSAVTKSQIAAIFFAMIGTMIPAVQYSGLTNPVSSLEGTARYIGDVYPATHMVMISRGVFNKALTFTDLQGSFMPMIIAALVIMLVAVLLLRKQER